MQVVASSYPYFKKSCEENESYLYNLLLVLDYKHHLRAEVLTLIVNK